DEVEARAVAVRAGAAEAGHREVDEGRPLRDERLVPDAERVHRACAEVLDDDVGAPHEREERALALGSLEVQHERSLVAVEAEEARAVLRSRGERAEPARVVALAGRLDLHYVGAHVAEQRPRVWSGHEVAELENADAVEGEAAHGLPHPTRVRLRRASRSPRRRGRGALSSRVTSRTPARAARPPRPAAAAGLRRR